MGWGKNKSMAKETSMNSSRESFPSIFLSICLKILSVLFSGVDSSSGIFITDPTWLRFCLSMNISKFDIIKQSAVHFLYSKSAFLRSCTMVGAPPPIAAHSFQNISHRKNNDIFTLSKFCIMTKWKIQPANLRCNFPRGKTGLWPSCDAFSTTKHKNEMILQQFFFSFSGAYLIF